MISGTECERIPVKIISFPNGQFKKKYNFVVEIHNFIIKMTANLDPKLKTLILFNLRIIRCTIDQIQAENDPDITDYNLKP